jgi:hypothetical protein
MGYVRSQRFQCGQITDGKLLMFGLIDPAVLDGFSTTAIMSANLECTAAYQHLVRRGHTFQHHSALSSRLRFTSHTTARLDAITHRITDALRRSFLYPADGPSRAMNS